MTITRGRRLRRMVHVGGTSARSLHLLDVENMLGGLVTSSRVSEMWASYQLNAPVAVGDHVVAGFGPMTAEEGVFALPPTVRKLVAPAGPDAADRILIEAVDVEFVHRRFARVIIASGDARFAPLAWQLRLLDVRVLYVDTKASGVSWLLHRCCYGHITIPAPASVHRLHQHISAA